MWAKVCGNTKAKLLNDQSPKNPQVTELRKGFFTPRLVGERFEQHSIPLDVAKDLAVLEDLLVGAAKHIYKSEYDRQKGPRNLRAGVSLRIEGISEGSAIAYLQLAVTPNVKDSANVLDCLDTAKERILQAVNAAMAGDKKLAREALPAELLSMFGKLGSSFGDNEYIELAPNSTEDERARLDRKTRRFLVGIYDKDIVIEQSVEVRGKIGELDKIKLTCQIELPNGKMLHCKLNRENLRKAESIFLEYEHGGRVFISGTGTVTANGQVGSVESIRELELLPTHDIVARLDELKHRNQSLFEGDDGLLNSTTLDWFQSNALTVFDADHLLPAIYPQEETGLALEWSINGLELSLEINTKDKTGYLHSWDSKTDIELSETIELQNLEGWLKVAEFVETRHTGQDQRET